LDAHPVVIGCFLRQAMEKVRPCACRSAKTNARGRTYEDTKELKVTDNDSSLKAFRMSDLPYYEDKTLSLTATFTKAPKEIDMTLTNEAGKSHRPEMRSRNERLEWEGYFTPDGHGYYTARLDYTDGGDGKNYSEHFTIHVTQYYGEGGDVIVSNQVAEKMADAILSTRLYCVCYLVYRVSSLKKGAGKWKNGDRGY
jgi:hypothetical protein